MKRVLGRILSTIIVAGGWLFVGGRIVLELIGYSTIPEDVEVAGSRLDQALGLLLSTPWWALLGFALISTLWLIWVSWPRSAPPKATKPATEPQSIKSRSPRQIAAQVEILPQRFIKLIDQDDREIGRRIGLHNIRHPIQLIRQLDAPDPYLDFTIHLWNRSVFELTIVAVTGHFSYKAHALRDSPRLLNQGVMFPLHQSMVIKLRQYLTPHIAEQMKQWSECEFGNNDVYLQFTYLNRHNETKQVSYRLIGRCHLVDLG